eukprot:TRINITY_DN7367_c0_g1_i1.p1 TRINITY_DN7367_c0_g1~~TRINITY_DN7367_c0_g1_i1.p1  ORF type:complete len:293 (+),score=70.46 TRINITY_DN7367_c0_g1_i1:45-881(+)
MSAASDIVTNFLLNAPPGEFHDVVTDVRNLLGDDATLNEVAPYTFHEYNTEQMLVVENEGHKVLVSKAGEVGNSEYLDPVGKSVFSYDHFKGEVTGSRPEQGELDGEIEPWRSAIEAKAMDYAANHYDLGAGAVYSKREDNGNFNVTFAVSSALFNPNNYYNGRWRSEWSIVFTPGGAADVTGHIRVNVHYYEDGNVQLNTNTVKRAACRAGNPESLAAEALKAISNLEQEFHAALETSYDAMNETSFKALRRALPMTHTKIQWQKISQYKLGQDLGK